MCLKVHTGWGGGVILDGIKRHLHMMKSSPALEWVGQEEGASHTCLTSQANICRGIGQDKTRWCEPYTLLINGEQTQGRPMPQLVHARTVVHGQTHCGEAVCRAP